MRRRGAGAARTYRGETLPQRANRSTFLRASTFLPVSISPSNPADRATRTTTRIIRVDPARVTPLDLAEAGRIIREGGLVAFPTETVYGLGANALDAAAVQRIYVAKGRPSFNPLIVHVSGLTGASEVAEEIPEVALALAAAFWPGPLTLVMKRRAHVPTAVTAGLDTVGVRAPAHPVAQALIAAAGVPIAAPSANRYTRVSPTSAAHVVAQLGDRIDMIVDGGESDVGIESTVLDLTSPIPTILRPGSVSRSALERVAGPVAVIAREPSPGDETPRRAPGMVDRHYAPNAPLTFVTAGARDEASRQLQILRARGKVGVLSYSDGMPEGDVTLRLSPEPDAYARALYAALHTIDDAGCVAALVERVPTGDAWEGVADRLLRASAPPAAASARRESQ